MLRVRPTVIQSFRIVQIDRVVCGIARLRHSFLSRSNSFFCAELWLLRAIGEPLFSWCTTLDKTMLTDDSGNILFAIPEAFNQRVSRGLPAPRSGRGSRLWSWQDPCGEEAPGSCRCRFRPVVLPPSRLAAPSSGGRWWRRRTGVAPSIGMQLSHESTLVSVGSPRSRERQSSRQRAGCFEGAFALTG